MLSMIFDYSECNRVYGAQLFACWVIFKKMMSADFFQNYNPGPKMAPPRWSHVFHIYCYSVGYF